MYDFVTISKAYEFKPPKKYKDKLEPNTKIAAFKLTSRYKRSTSKKFISENSRFSDFRNFINYRCDSFIDIWFTRRLG